jgi:hypothetical protein
MALLSCSLFIGLADCESPALDKLINRLDQDEKTTALPLLRDVEASEDFTSDTENSTAASWTFYVARGERTTVDIKIRHSAAQSISKKTSGDEDRVTTIVTDADGLVTTVTVNIEDKEEIAFTLVVEESGKNSAELSIK